MHCVQGVYIDHKVKAGNSKPQTVSVQMDAEEQLDVWRILDKEIHKVVDLRTAAPFLHRAPPRRETVGSEIKLSRISQSVQWLSHVWLFATPWTVARQASQFITNSQSLLKLMSIKLVMRSNHLVLCCPLLLLPPIPPSIRVFSSESTLLMRWPKDWSFSFSISPSNEHPGLIFRMDWLDLLAVQGTLKNLL